MLIKCSISSVVAVVSSIARTKYLQNNLAKCTRKTLKIDYYFIIHIVVGHIFIQKTKNMQQSRITHENYTRKKEKEKKMSCTRTDGKRKYE